MTKIQLPANERTFAELLERARAGAGKASTLKPTSPAGQDRKSSPAGPTLELEGPGPKVSADPRPKAAAPARTPEKAKTEEVPELEPELDLHDVFFGRRR